MRILWVCNILPPLLASALGKPYSVREGWLTGLLMQLLEQRDRDVELGVCFPVEDRPEALEWRVCPAEGLGEVACYGFWEDVRREEVYEISLEARFAVILADFQPDLVHIFGTEFGHALACARAWGRKERTLVGLQGVCSAIAKAYMADLPKPVQKSRSLRDILKGDSLPKQQKKYALRGEREAQLLALAGHVTGRTRLDREAAARMNPQAAYHFMNETMRSCFYQGQWRLERCRRHEIFVSQADYPLKGFHYLLEAMPEILQTAPDARIVVAGNSILGTKNWLSRLKRPAYGKYLWQLIEKNGLAGKITATGRLEAEQMKLACLSCHVMVCPSALENSPNSVAEAQLLGTPVVAARVGGIPDVVEDGKDGFLFERGDVSGLAKAVLRLFASDALALALSEQEKRRALVRYDGEANCRRLYEIYTEILADGEKSE